MVKKIHLSLNEVEDKIEKLTQSIELEETKANKTKRKKIVPSASQPAKSNQWTLGIPCRPWNQIDQIEGRKGKKNPEEAREEEKGYTRKEKIK